MNTTSLVMVGLVPTIHVFSTLTTCGVQNVDARRKGEHDELEPRRGHGFRAFRCAKSRNDGWRYRSSRQSPADLNPPSATTL